MKRSRLVLAALLAGLAAMPLTAARADDDASMQSIEAYRDALKDGNPAELFEDTGKELWQKKAGPKNASLEQCDLGLGAGVVKGAYAQLPRYFKDTDRVQDLESRLLTCMEKLQGVNAADYVKAPFGTQPKNDLNALATYISGQSKGMTVKVPLSHPKEKQAYNLGKRLFYYQGGPYDFSCATCHGQEGLRIRLQQLPALATPKGAASSWTTWPAYRVSSGDMWGMQWRIADCFRQQRFPEPGYASPATIALSTFIAATANGSKLDTPGIKR